MSIRDEELLARLRTLGSTVRRGSMAAAGDEAVSLLGLSEQDLTPSVRVALRHLIEELAALRQELGFTQTRLAELERLANEDALAPISNRRAFLRDLARTIGYVERYGVACSLLYFDLDGLKTINDTFGHMAGDRALVDAADVLRASFRSADIIARLGGDEFTVFPLEAAAESGRLLMHRLDEQLQAHNVSHPQRGYRLALSVGIARFEPDSSWSIEQLLEHADRALYEHKRQNRP